MKKFFLFLASIIVIGAAALTLYPRASEAPVSLPTSHSTTTIVSSPVVTATASPIKAAENSVVTSETTQTPNVTLIAGTSTYHIFARAGSNVADTMSALAQRGEFAFTSREYSGMGIFVDSINGKYNTGSTYWFLYINGKSSVTGPSQTTLKDGDVIEWRYKQSE